MFCVWPIYAAFAVSFETGESCTDAHAAGSSPSNGLGSSCDARPDLGRRPLQQPQHRQQPAEPQSNVTSMLPQALLPVQQPHHGTLREKHVPHVIIAGVMKMLHRPSTMPTPMAALKASPRSFMLRGLCCKSTFSLERQPMRCWSCNTTLLLSGEFSFVASVRTGWQQCSQNCELSSLREIAEQCS